MRHWTDVDENSLAASIFVLVAALVSVDLIADALEGTAPIHLGVELLAATLALVAGVGFFRRWLAVRAEAARWRAQAEELLGGVGRTIEAQFTDWSLTEAEREVGILLLKGLSLKEVAAVRGTSERTARDQARAVYKKGGLAGRAELSAWFLEDLLPER